MKSSDFQDRTTAQLATLIERMDNFKADFSEFKLGVGVKVDNQETRLQKLENKESNYAGKFAIIGTLVIFASNVLWTIIKDSFTK